MNAPRELDPTLELTPSAPDVLDAGLAAAFAPPRTGLDVGGAAVSLRGGGGDSSQGINPHSDAMPSPELTGNRYSLQGELARGGMGAVLRGRDEDLGRDLAVKVLLTKYLHHPEVARRFLEEAQIGGQLQHPGIVPVYDIGRFGNRPFFTMKLVKGQTLAALLRERQDLVTDRPRLLAIALQVAQTLAYAHSKGVIHRDLKPSNIMVGAFGEVQVMDWGLAKVLSEVGSADSQASGLPALADQETTIRTLRSGAAGSGSTAGGSGTETEAGALLGTPAYMPPEQAKGRVALLDRRCDVFGIGALLCEILTGEPPYCGPEPEDVRLKAASADLADAHTRLDACGAEVELIGLTKKCLAPEAGDRPRDAQEVAESLTAYLDGVQVRLRQAELAEAASRAKASEETKRRRVTLALAALILLTVGIGGGGWLRLYSKRVAWQARVTRDVTAAISQARVLREQAKAAPAGSLPLFAQARGQLERAMALVESGPTDRALLTQVRELKTELDDEEQDYQLVRALEEARLAQARVRANLNLFDRAGAIPLFRQALADYGMVPGVGDVQAAAERIRGRPQAVRDAILASLDDWLELAQGPDWKEAEPQLAWLSAVLVASETENSWSQRFRAARDEADAAVRQTLLGALAADDAASSIPPAGLTRVAKTLAPQLAVNLLRRAQHEYPGDFWINHDLGTALRRLSPPKADEAVRYLSVAVALRPENAGVRVNLGAALEAAGQWDEALASYRKAIEIEPDYGVAYCNIGNVLRSKRELDEAIRSYRRSIELTPQLVTAHMGLGSALEACGQVDEAEACFRRAIELDPLLPMAYGNLGIAVCNQGRMEEAIEHFHKVIELDPHDPKAYSNLGYTLYRLGRQDEALENYRRAIEINPRHAQAHFNLSAALSEMGQLEEALASCRQVLELEPGFTQAKELLGQLERALAERQSSPAPASSQDD
jgi:eukaryotic-like serine/threonine-protein kinase